METRKNKTIEEQLADALIDEYQQETVSDM